MEGRIQRGAARGSGGEPRRQSRLGCTIAAGTIEDAAEGALGRTRRAFLARHVRGCPECGGYFGRMKAVLSILEELPTIPAPAGFTEHVLEVVAAGLQADAGPAEDGSAYRHRWPWVAGAVLAGAAALSLAIWRVVAAPRGAAEQGEVVVTVEPA